MKYISVASGSSGNCHMVLNDNTKILIDAGLSGNKIEENLKKLEINLNDTKAILITHEHIDHIRGAGVLSRRYDIPIYANKNTWDCMQDKLGKINEKNKITIENHKEFFIQELKVTSFSINHDAVDPVAYIFENENKKVSILTDTGSIGDDMKKYVLGSDLIILESNHDEEMLKMGSYPYYLKRRILSNKGHLSNEDAGKMCVDLVKNGTNKILLAHLSIRNNFPELAYETVKSILMTFKINLDDDLYLEVLKRDSISNLYVV